MMVPGLADAAGVSFRSVNFPDRYLRQSNLTAMRIDPNDGTAAFPWGRHLLPGGGPGRLGHVLVPVVLAADEVHPALQLRPAD